MSPHQMHILHLADLFLLITVVIYFIFKSSITQIASSDNILSSRFSQRGNACDAEIGLCCYWLYANVCVCLLRGEPLHYATLGTHLHVFCRGF